MLHRNNYSSSRSYPSSITGSIISMSLNQSSNVNQVNNPTSLQDSFLRIPFITRCILILCILVHITIFLFSIPLMWLSISTHQIIHGEIYRIITSTFVHSGLLHIFFNMSSLLQLGTDIESQFGSLSFFVMTAWAILLSGLMYCLLSMFTALITGDNGYYFTSGVGFSGILFVYAIIDSFHTTQVTRSVFGLFNVPAKIYPFILLIILQVVLPNISFFGHLAGVLVGLLAIGGVLDILLPSSQGLQYLELTSCLQMMYRQSSFVRDTNKSYSVYGNSSPSYALCSTIASGFFYLLTNIWYGISALLHILGCPTQTCTERISRWSQSNPSDSVEYSSATNPMAASTTSITNPTHPNGRRLGGTSRSILLQRDEEMKRKVAPSAPPIPASTSQGEYHSVPNEDSLL